MSHCIWDFSYWWRKKEQYHWKANPNNIIGTKDLIDLYCSNCKLTTKIKRGPRRKSCRQCKTVIMYKCSKCNNKYKTYHKAFLHARRVCRRAISLRCSACHYYTRTKENLDNHLRSQHTVQKCSDCGEKCQNNQMKKHKFFACKAKGRRSSNYGEFCKDENV